MVLTWQYARPPVHSLGIVLSRLCKGDGEFKTCSLRLSWWKIIKVVEVHLEAANGVFLVQILNFVCLTYDKKPGKIYFFACAFTLVTFLVTFFVTLQEFKSRLRLVSVLTGEFLVNPCLKSYATFSCFLCFFNAPTTWNTAAIKILSLFKVGLMAYLFISDGGKRRINERIPGSVPGDNEVFGPGNKVLGVKSIGREQNCSSFLFAFKIKVLVILKMIQWHYQLKNQNWPVCELIKKFASNPKS